MHRPFAVSVRDVPVRSGSKHSRRRIQRCLEGAANGNRSVQAGLKTGAAFAGVVVDQMVPFDAAQLLAGDTVRGVSDAELGGIVVPVAVMAPDVPNLFHPYRTVHRLVDLIPLAVRFD